MFQFPDAVILDVGPYIKTFRQRVRKLDLHYFEVEDFVKRLINSMHDVTEIDNDIQECICEIDEEYSNVYPQRDLGELVQALRELAHSFANHLISIHIYIPDTGIMPYRYKKLLSDDSVAVVFDLSDALGS